MSHPRRLGDSVMVDRLDDGALRVYIATVTDDNECEMVTLGICNTPMEAHALAMKELEDVL